MCRLPKTRKGHKAIGKYQLSYSRLRDTFMELLKPITKEETKSFGLHSLRSGGATAAANNNISDRLIGKHGRWASSSNRDKYIKDSNTSRYSISKALGLQLLFFTLQIPTNTKNGCFYLFCPNKE